MIFQRGLVVVSALLLSVQGSTDGPLCFPGDKGNAVCPFPSLPGGTHWSGVVAALLNATKDLQVPQNDIFYEPKAFDVPLPPTTGPLAWNTLIDQDGSLEFKGLEGAESMLVRGDYFYGATVNGIIRVNKKTGARKTIFNATYPCNDDKAECSRPLGIRFGAEDLIYCADALLGLIQVNEKTGEYKVLVPTGTPVEGVPMLFADDLDVDLEKKVIYFSDGSTKRDLHSWFLSVVEYEDSSRVIRYDIESGKTSVFAKGLHFANGIQLSYDKKYLLVDEFSSRRVLKYPILGEKAGEPVVFVENLPGNPDNIRPSLNGGYWLALALSRPNSTKTIVEELQANPGLNRKLVSMLTHTGGLLNAVAQLGGGEDFAKVAQKMKTGCMFGGMMPKVGMVVELDSEGRVLQVLYSEKNYFFTEPLEVEDGLYLGSFINPFVAKVPKKNFRKA